MIQAHTLLVDESRFCSWLQWKRENAAKQPTASVSAAGSSLAPLSPPAAAGGGGGGDESDGGTAAVDIVEAPAMPEGLSKMEQMKVSISDHPPHGLRE